MKRERDYSAAVPLFAGCCIWLGGFCLGLCAGCWWG